MPRPPSTGMSSRGTRKPPGGVARARRRPTRRGSSAASTAPSARVGCNDSDVQQHRERGHDREPRESGHAAPPVTEKARLLPRAAAGHRSARWSPLRALTTRQPAPRRTAATASTSGSTRSRLDFGERQVATSRTHGDRRPAAVVGADQDLRLVDRRRAEHGDEQSVGRAEPEAVGRVQRDRPRWARPRRGRRAATPPGRRCPGRCRSHRRRCGRRCRSRGRRCSRRVRRTRRSTRRQRRPTRRTTPAPHPGGRWRGCRAAGCSATPTAAPRAAPSARRGARSTASAPGAGRRRRGTRGSRRRPRRRRRPSVTGCRPEPAQSPPSATAGSRCTTGVTTRVSRAENERTSSHMPNGSESRIVSGPME